MFIALYTFLSIVAITTLCALNMPPRHDAAIHLVKEVTQYILLFFFPLYILCVSNYPRPFSLLCIPEISAGFFWYILQLSFFVFVAHMFGSIYLKTSLCGIISPAASLSLRKRSSIHCHIRELIWIITQIKHDINAVYLYYMKSVSKYRKQQFV